MSIDYPTRWRAFWPCLTILGMQLIGCSSAPKYLAEPDRLVAKYSEHGREAYNEGLLKDAVKEYKQAVVRAWAIDDPYESGTAAYNLAACLVGEEKCDEANLWLVDARVDLCRAKVSTGNTWLLTANIAVAQCRYDDAHAAIDQAACAGATCDLDQPYRLHGPAAQFVDENCDPPCGSKLPWIGKRIQQKKEQEDCQLEYKANVALSRARLAAAQLDVCTARKHLQQTATCADGVCSLALLAGRHNVAAQIYDVEANYLQAGAHRDCEVELLRAMGEYREIPKILRAAADSYCLAERCDLAIDRLIRCARVYTARQEYDKAWCNLKLAGNLIANGTCPANEIRFELTAQILEEKLAKKMPETE